MEAKRPIAAMSPTQQSAFVPNYHLLDPADAGIPGAVMDRSYRSQPVILWFEVNDIDASIRAIVESGGVVAGGRNTIPGEGHVQYMADPEGNVFGLKQPLQD